MTDTIEQESGDQIAADLRRVSLDDVRPYWRNPRKIPEKAVTAVADSIQRYGYRAKIIVDPDLTIIVGHTRYAALRRLGYTEIDVEVVGLTPEQAKEYRVLDNRAGEHSSWDEEALMAELREFSEEVLLAHFPEVDLSDQFKDDVDAVTAEDALAAEEAVNASVEQGDGRATATLTCPNCFNEVVVERATITFSDEE